MYTLNTTEVHAVAYGIEPGGSSKAEHGEQNP